MGLVDENGKYKKIMSSEMIDKFRKSLTGIGDEERIKNMKYKIAREFDVDINQIDFSEFDKMFKKEKEKENGNSDTKENEHLSIMPYDHDKGNTIGFPIEWTRDPDELNIWWESILEKMYRNGSLPEYDYKHYKNHKIEFINNYRDANGFATGGYTGNWSSDHGKLAFLHSKELVLNANDTENFLKATNLLRDISKLNGNIEESIMASILNMMNLVSPHVSGVNAGAQPGETQAQVFNITAEFPNANDVTSIKEAILSLPNIASQYVHQRA